MVNYRKILKFFSLSTLLFIFMVTFFSYPVVASQHETTTTGGTLKEKYESQTQSFQGEEGASVEPQDPRRVVALIIRWTLGLVGIIALSYAIYGGYLILTSRGNEEMIEDGKSTLLTASVGILVILASYGITNFVVDSLYRSTQPACDPDEPFCTKVEIEQEPQGDTQKAPSDLEPRQEEKRKTWGWSY